MEEFVQSRALGKREVSEEGESPLRLLKLIIKFECSNNKYALVSPRVDVNP